MTPRRRQSEDRADFDPAVSPDRRRVAFVRRRGSGDSLWVVRLDGSGPRVVLEESQLQALFSGALELRSPAWSPDGKTLTAVVDEANGDCRSDGLINVSVDGLERNVLVRLAQSTHSYLTSAGWDPRGRSVAYVATSNDGCREMDGLRSVLSVVSADGSRQRRLGASYGWTYSAAWSPTGRWIALDGDCGSCNLYLANADGSGYRQLVPVNDYAEPFSFGWWKNKVIYTRSARSVFLVDPRKNAHSRLLKLPCARPGARRCAPVVGLDASSPTAAVFDLGTWTITSAFEVVSLPRASVRRLPGPRALRRSDQVVGFVVALPSVHPAAAVGARAS